MKDLQGNLQPKPSELPPFLNQDQTCKLLGIGRSSFYELVRCSQLPGAFRLGKKVRVNSRILLASLGTTEAGNDERS